MKKLSVVTASAKRRDTRYKGMDADEARALAEMMASRAILLSGMPTNYKSFLNYFATHIKCNAGAYVWDSEFFRKFRPNFLKLCTIFSALIEKDSDQIQAYETRRDLLNLRGLDCDSFIRGLKEWDEVESGASKLAAAALGRYCNASIEQATEEQVVKKLGLAAVYRPNLKSRTDYDRTYLWLNPEETRRITTESQILEHRQLIKTIVLAEYRDSEIEFAVPEFECLSDSYPTLMDVIKEADRQLELRVSMKLQRVRISLDGWLTAMLTDKVVRDIRAALRVKGQANFFTHVGQLVSLSTKADNKHRKLVDAVTCAMFEQVNLFYSVDEESNDWGEDEQPSDDSSDAAPSDTRAS